MHFRTSCSDISFDASNRSVCDFATTFSSCINRDQLNFSIYRNVGEQRRNQHTLRAGQWLMLHHVLPIAIVAKSWPWRNESTIKLLWTCCVFTLRTLLWHMHSHTDTHRTTFLFTNILNNFPFGCHLFSQHFRCCTDTRDLMRHFHSDLKGFLPNQKSARDFLYTWKMRTLHCSLRWINKSSTNSNGKFQYS